MNIKRIFSVATTFISTSLAIGARAYMATQPQGLVGGNVLANRLLFSSLNNASRALQNPDNAASSAATILPAAGLLMLSAFNQYQQRNNPRLPARQERGIVQAPVVVPPVKSLSRRLQDVGYHLDDLPEEYIDQVVTFEIMEDPVIAVTELKIKEKNREIIRQVEHTYDRKTFNRFNGIDPENRQPIKAIRDNTALKNKLVEFVETQEKAHRHHHATINPALPRPIAA